MVASRARDPDSIAGPPGDGERQEVVVFQFVEHGLFADDRHPLCVTRHALLVQTHAVACTVEARGTVDVRVSASQTPRPGVELNRNSIVFREVRSCDQRIPPIPEGSVGLPLLDQLFVHYHQLVVHKDDVQGTRAESPLESVRAHERIEYAAVIIKCVFDLYVQLGGGHGAALFGLVNRELLNSVNTRIPL